MTTHILPIVGAHFRPPAKALLGVLPMGTKLTLFPEPTNPYDANAVQILLDGQDIGDTISDATIADAIIGTGWSPEEVREGVLHLGYIPKTEAVWLQAKVPAKGLDGTLAFSMDGKPAIKFELGE